MKILIVSDTHGSSYELKKVIGEESPIDVLVHCGDICADLSSVLGQCAFHVHAVSGNCDFPGRYPQEDVFYLGEHKAFLAHGHRLNVRKDNDRLIRAAQDNGCDIAFYGHTHVPESVTDCGVYICNPGSLVQPRTSDGRPSYAVMTIDDETGETACHIRFLPAIPAGF